MGMWFGTSKSPPRSFASPSHLTHLGLAGETPWEQVLGLLPLGLDEGHARTLPAMLTFPLLSKGHAGL